MQGCLPYAPPIGLTSCVIVVATKIPSVEAPFPWRCRVMVPKFMARLTRLMLA